MISDAVNDTAPLAKLIRQYATDAFIDEVAKEYRRGRRIFILTTNLDAERPVIWDLSAIAASDRADRRDLFVNVLLASAAIPGVFPPIRINVVAADGRMYEELHVDGGVTAQMVYGPPDVQLMKIEDKIFPTRRTRRLYVIRNGKLFPEFKTSDPNALMRAGRSVETLVKYQIVSDLLRLEKIATANNTKFFFNSIPSSFSARPQSAFSESYSKELYKAGLEVGLHDRWDTSPPASPELDRRTPTGATPPPTGSSAAAATANGPLTNIVLVSRTAVLGQTR